MTPSLFDRIRLHVRDALLPQWVGLPRLARERDCVPQQTDGMGLLVGICGAVEALLIGYVVIVVARDILALVVVDIGIAIVLDIVIALHNESLVVVGRDFIDLSQVRVVVVSTDSGFQYLVLLAEERGKGVYRKHTREKTWTGLCRCLGSGLSCAY